MTDQQPGTESTQPASNTADEVRAAYRWILAREPDPDGLAIYTKMMEGGRLDRSSLRRTLLDSAEFRRERPSFRIVDTQDEVKVAVDPEDGDLGTAIARYGCWEPFITAMLRAELKEGDVFLDIGGNVGLMSFVAAKAVGPTGKVIAFEPSTVNAGNYRRGIVANRFDNVLLHNLAVSDRPGLLSITPNSNGKASEGADPGGAHEVIQAVALDSFLEHEPRIDFVKIDIEGYEVRALQGMMTLLRKHKPMMDVEFNPLHLREQGGVDPRVLADMLLDLGGGKVLVGLVEGGFVAFTSTDAIMAEVDARNREGVEKGWFPDGWACLDIVLWVV